jgi:Ca2+-binding EF-hand superfamily protein
MFVPTLTKRLSADELSNLKAVFDKIDFDGSGSLEEDKLAVALKDMGLAPDPGKVAGLFQRFAKTKRGSITFNEFLLVHQKSAADDPGDSGMFMNLVGLELSSMGLEMPSSLSNLGAEATRRMSAGAAGFFNGGTEPNPVAAAVVDEEAGEVFEAYRPALPAASRPMVHSMDDWNATTTTTATATHSTKVEESKTAAEVSAPRLTTRIGSSLDGPLANPTVGFLLPPDDEDPEEEAESPSAPGLDLDDAQQASGAPASQNPRARRATSTALTPEQAKRARRVFSRIDFDHSGGLDLEEVKLALQEMGAAADAAAVAAMFR